MDPLMVLTIGELRAALQDLPDSALVGFAASETDSLIDVRPIWLIRSGGLAVVVQRTPREIELFDAVTRNDQDAVRALAAAGVDLNSRDPRASVFDGATALTVAAEGGFVEMVELLLAHGADVDAQSASGWTALMRACNNGQLKTAERLLDAGANSRIRNYDGYTAYGRVPGNCVELRQLLEKRGAA